MGKRSNFSRIAKDKYYTPLKPAKILVSHIGSKFTYVEPCAGDGSLIRNLEHATNGGAVCRKAFDIEPDDKGIQQMDALEASASDLCAGEYIITNPPWSREILHPMIERFCKLRPTWLLFDADWMHTKQARPYIRMGLKEILAVGRVKWFADSNATGKDNVCWYLFDSAYFGSPRFIIPEE